MTIPLFKVFMCKDAPQKVSDTLLSGMLTQAARVDEFERELQEWFNYPYILTVNSATSGLTLAYRLLNVNKDTEVLTTPLTCFATTAAILNHTQHITWVDVDPSTCTIDLEDARRKLTAKTEVLTIVHWGGYPVNMDQVGELKKYAHDTFGTRLQVVEDCAHAFGAEWRGMPLGVYGDNIAVYSLQAIKHLTTGDGGLIFLPNQQMYKRAKLLRWYGVDRECKRVGDSRLETDIIEYGYKFHMNDLNATIGLVNLPHIRSLLQKCRDNARTLDKALRHLYTIRLLERHPHAKPSPWIYTIRIKHKLLTRFIDFMTQRGIHVSQVHKRNDTHTCVAHARSTLLNVDVVTSEFISIPVGWWLSLEDVNFIIKSIYEFDDTFRYKVSLLKSTNRNAYKRLMIHLNGYVNEKDENDEKDESSLDGVYGLWIAGELVASAKLWIEPKLYDPVGHIEDVVTLPTHRHKGYASYILKHLQEIGLRAGCHKIVLHCSQDMTPLYKQCGFSEEGVSMVLRRTPRR
jgi:dTDP-4-amino-4,6-dideoxygalactose transaminase/GNAT superfamily N-acetyltransferase